MDEAKSRWLGSGTISPDEPVEAGASGTWTIVYTAGVAGIDDGGRIRIAWRSVSDWPAPQFSAPEQANYATVSTDAPVTLTPVYGSDGVRPWNRTLTIRVSDGALAAGETVTVVLGDTSGGSPGMRAQTFPERRFRFKLQADPFATGVYEDVTDLGFPIVGGEAVRFEIVVPSDVVAGEPFRLQVRALDRWGNPDPAYRGTCRFIGEKPGGLPDSYTMTAQDSGIHWFERLTLEQPGVSSIAVEDGDGRTGRSNPLRCHAEQPEWRLYWGDPHGQTEETVGTGSIDDYLAYARDVAAINMTGHQGNDFQITAEVYERIQSALAGANEPGRFVTFFGYEWSGNTPAGGDHNVHYRDGGPIHRSSHTLIPYRSDIDSDRYPVDALYATFAGREDVLLVPHIGGRHASLAYHDPALEPVIEIASQWGRFEWFARDALERGLKVGFVGGSDDHSGRPGWSAATVAHHGVRGGLMAILAPDLTRESLWDALRARRCYGTSGPRIILDLSVSGHPMGSEPTLTEPPLVRCHVIGATDLDTIEIRRGLETVHVEHLLPQPRPGDRQRIRLAWRGARNRGRGRALDWSGRLDLRGGRITGAENYAIDHPLDGITGWDATHVAWRSHTVGDWDGIILDLEGDDSSVIDVSTPTMSLCLALDDIPRDGYRQTGDLLEQQLVVRRIGTGPGRREAQIEWQDTTPTPGVNPYWIWVTQADGELAWSSPVYATVGKAQ
ncbi:MAG TPA: DUF3604 domain-containing protein [Thermomicrobiales bacterium]|nr:DUF3604 domain-containing protein [Thermomicrobiales bacterium]